MRREDGSDVYQFICPTCFANEAETQGYEPVSWVLEMQESREQFAREVRLAALEEAAQIIERENSRLAVNELIPFEQTEPFKKLTCVLAAALRTS
jgi:hypothetical protein